MTLGIDAELRIVERNLDGPRAQVLRRRAGLPEFVFGDEVMGDWRTPWKIFTGLVVKFEPSDDERLPTVLVRNSGGDHREKKTAMICVGGIPYISLSPRL